MYRIQLIHRKLCSKTNRLVCIDTNQKYIRAVTLTRKLPVSVSKFDTQKYGCQCRCRCWTLENLVSVSDSRTPKILVSVSVSDSLTPKIQVSVSDYLTPKILVSVSVSDSLTPKILVSVSVSDSLTPKTLVSVSVSDSLTPKPWCRYQCRIL